jgi:hypothetical protein
MGRRWLQQHYGDFVFTMQVVLHQSLGASLDDALARANETAHRQIGKAEFVTSGHWRKMNRLAHRYALIEMKTQVAGIFAQVLSKWHQATAQMLNIILNGRLDRDRIEAYKALQDAFVKPLIEAPEPEEENEQREYLRRIRKAPPRIIQVVGKSESGEPSSVSSEPSEESVSAPKLLSESPDSTELS